MEGSVKSLIEAEQRAKEIISQAEEGQSMMMKEAEAMANMEIMKKRDACDQLIA